MFRPHVGICICHEEQRLIVVKKGYCKIGNDEQKRIKRTGNDRQGDTSAMGITQRKHSNTRIKLYGGNKKNEPPGIQKNVSVGKTSSFKTKASKKKRGKIKYMRRNTGEAQATRKAFEEALEDSWPECPKCNVCKTSLGYQVRTYHGSHVLAKQTYAAFRLWKRNLWLCCLSCHSGWDQGLDGKNRSDDIYSEKRRVAATLKQFYYWLTHKNRMTSDLEELEILFKEFENE